MYRRLRRGPPPRHRRGPHRRTPAGLSRQVHRRTDHPAVRPGLRTAGEVRAALTHWTGAELAAEAGKRGIVESISASQVNRLLREAELRPQRSRYWLNTTEKDPALFQAQVQVVCACYHDAPQLYFHHDTHTLSVDEMTGIQALERVAATLPLKPGRA